MNALIFGINGQDGHYLSEICQEKKIEVIGISRSPGPWISGNVADKEFVALLVKKYTPAYIFHLAANSNTRHESLFEHHETISLGTLNILESVKNHSPSSKVFITGSAVQFLNKGLPVKETDPFEANSSYSVARIHSVYATRYYRSLGIKAYVGYLFHHDSPLRKPTHVSKYTTDIIKKIAKNEAGSLAVNNIEIKKEWAFARDTAEGMFTLVSQNNVYEAVIGTGKAYSIKDWLKTCFDIIGKNWEDFVTLSGAKIKPDFDLLVSNPETIKSLGWRPKTELREAGNDNDAGCNLKY